MLNSTQDQKYNRNVNYSRVRILLTGVQVIFCFENHTEIIHFYRFNVLYSLRPFLCKSRTHGIDYTPSHCTSQVNPCPFSIEMVPVSLCWYSWAGSHVLWPHWFWLFTCAWAKSSHPRRSCRNPLCSLAPVTGWRFCGPMSSGGSQYLSHLWFKNGNLNSCIAEFSVMECSSTMFKINLSLAGRST